MWGILHTYAFVEDIEMFSIVPSRSELGAYCGASPPSKTSPYFRGGSGGGGGYPDALLALATSNVTTCPLEDKSAAQGLRGIIRRRKNRKNDNDY